jgi:hypothetical protein
LSNVLRAAAREIVRLVREDGSMLFCGWQAHLMRSAHWRDGPAAPSCVGMPQVMPVWADSCLRASIVPAFPSLQPLAETGVQAH